MRDFIAESAIIARYLPELGNPLDLPIDDFSAYLRSCFDYLQRQADPGSDPSSTDHRSHVEEQMRRIHGGL